MEDAWNRLRKDVAFAQRVASAGSTDSRAELVEAIEEVSSRCREERVLQKASEEPEDLSDEKIIKAARFTDGVPLAPFAKILSLTPRLVNVRALRIAPCCASTASRRRQVVTLAEAVPCPDSGLTLPLDLHFIASRCSNSYYAPRRFAAVQLAFSAPRARVLVFHTGRVVGTGTRRSAPPMRSHPYPPSNGHRLFGPDGGEAQHSARPTPGSGENAFTEHACNRLKRTLRICTRHAPC